MSISLILICLVVGTLIGAVGVGGVLLVPALDFFAGISVHEAIPACMFSYLATGAIGAVVFARHGSIQWASVGWIGLGAVPAAYLGATSLLSIPPFAVKLLIATLMIVAGVDALKRKAHSGEETRKLSSGALIAAGLATGFGSAITGTGGPLILVPLAIYLGLPVLTAVGLSQAIQIPIAMFATIGNWQQGNLNIALGITIAASMVVGTAFGATLIHKLPAEPIKKAVAILLLLVGLGIAIQILFGFVNS